MLNYFGKKQKQASNHKNKGAVKEFVAKLSRGLMLPIAMLPIAGLFLGIGSAITSTAPTSDGLQAIFGNIISAGGNIIFGCLPVLFCIAIAITFTGDAGVAGLSSFVGWIVFCALQSALIVKNNVGDATVYSFLFFRNFNEAQYNAIFTTNLGIESLSTGVFGGIVVGWCTAYLYNKFKNIQLPTVLGFFSGVRFIPIITFLAMIVLGFLFAIIWPWIGLGFYWMGSGLSSAPAGLNSLVFGYFNRALVPFGLHHVINTALWFTSVGGTFDPTKSAIVQVNGAYYCVGSSSICSWADAIPGLSNDPVVGDINIFIFLQQLVGKHVDLYPVSGGSQILNYVLNYDCIIRGTKYVNDGLLTCNPGQYTSGAYIFTIFALPSAALAMLFAAPKGENRKVAMSIVVSAAFVCFLTGITEPIEFTFLFLAPWLYWGFHAMMGAVAYMIPTCMALYMPTGLGCHVAFSFSSGFLDFSIYGLVNDAKGGGTNCYWLLLFSAVYGVIYYFIFYFAILKFDLKTPGRGSDKLFTKKDYLAAQVENASGKQDQMNILANAVIQAYGGKSNIKNVDACITKLRVQVVEQSKVDKEALLALGARGVMKPSAESVYAVFGTQADRIKNEMKAIISGSAPETTAFSSLKNTPIKSNKPSTNVDQSALSICAPVEGEVVSTKNVKDETFSSDLMGRGFAIKPVNGNFVAPVSGTVTLIDNHAYAVKASNGIEVLVHIGIDTVKLANKKYFTHHVKVGDSVKVGDMITSVNLANIKKHKLDTITPVVVLNESIGSRKISILKFGKQTPGNPVLKIK